MVISSDLLRAERVGVRELREQLSKKIKKGKLIVVTDHGDPINVLIPYEDILELIDILEEIQDSETLQTIHAGRAAVREGAKGISVSDVFKKIKSHRNK
jgi:antitoxin (DNA-binding transcriptional repressor) of toxin-antitoxin stability system